MILITGAGGKTGRALIQALIRRGGVLRALVRRPEQIAPTLELGAQEAIAGDLQDPASLQKALLGVKSVYHICPNLNLHEISIGRSIIQASRAAGVTHFVYHSVIHPNTEKMPHHWQKMRVEEILFESGLSFSILQPCVYMQNIRGYWEQITAQGVYAVPYPPKTRISQVDLEDVAEAAAIVLTQAGHESAIYELTGPLPISPAEMAVVLSQKLNRPVRAEQIPLDEWKRDAAATKMGHYAVETLYNMFGYYTKFGLTGNPRVLEWLLGRKARTFDEFVTKFMIG
jgi:NAD(P)H dehydrogenase (quinone)